MGTLTLITGGSRSGKSRHAQRLAERIGPPRAFIATAPVTDAEMAQRIERHRRDRAGHGWITIEEPADLCAALRNNPGPRAMLVDCLTLWISNLLFALPPAEMAAFDEAAVERRTLDLVAAAREHAGHVIFVTNEVGMGIVPENALARQFRDLSGRCNQVMAAHADTVIFMVCGVPLVVKGTTPEKKEP